MFRKEARRFDIAVAACPAVGYEFLRAQNSKVKRQRIDALTRGGWARLMPDSYSEALEVKSAIGLLHPEWINPHPDLRMWYLNKSDWETGWWRRARRDPETSAGHIALLEGDRLELARQESREMREQARRERWSFETVPLDLHDVAAPGTPGWDGEPFDVWRAHAEFRWRKALDQGRGADYEWLSPWLLRDMDRATWVNMWLREISADQVPRAWLRWAFQQVQATRTTTNGTPVDNQIASYLPECDVFVTADKAFAECVERIRPHSPVALGRGVRARANAAAVDDVMDVMADMATSP